MRLGQAIRRALLADLLLAVLIGGLGCQGPASSALDTPRPSLDTCDSDDDCLLVIRVDVCCPCPEVTTRARLEATGGVEPHTPERDYAALRPARCALVDCAPCPPPPAGAICGPGGCREPITVQEILKACPECSVQAAQAAYRERDFKKAIRFCNQAASEDQWTCFSQLFSKAIESEQLGQAEQLCRQHLAQDLGNCLRTLALEWARLDQQRAVALCDELNVDDARHFGCVLDVALVIRREDLDRALDVCEELPPDESSLCKEEVQHAP